MDPTRSLARFGRQTIALAHLLLLGGLLLFPGVAWSWSFTVDPDFIRWVVMSRCTPEVEMWFEPAVEGDEYTTAESVTVHYSASCVTSLSVCGVEYTPPLPAGFYTDRGTYCSYYRDPASAGVLTGSRTLPSGSPIGSYSWFISGYNSYNGRSDLEWMHWRIVAWDPEVPDNAYCSDVAHWDSSWSGFEERVLELTNARRAAGATCGSERFAPAPPLTMNAALRCAARSHSKDMDDRGFYNHTNPSGETPEDRAEAAGYEPPWRRLGENIYRGPSTPEAAVQGWMDSDHHCVNIMDPYAEEIGVGFYSGSRNYWTQVFGSQY